MAGSGIAAQELDPNAAAYLRRLAENPLPPLHLSTLADARARHEAASAALDEPIEAVASLSDLVVHKVSIRLYAPAGARGGGVIYVHGGGWVSGSVHSYDAFCRALANRSKTAVASVAYTLSPEARHPAQVEEVLAVLRWALAGGIDGPVVLAGDSAGGYLVAWGALRASHEALPISGQVLAYPALEPSLCTESARTRARGYRLETATLRWYWQHSMPRDRQLPSIFGENLSRLPPTLMITAGFDPLEDEGALYATTLRAAGVRVEHAHYPRQLHGFLRMRGFIPEASDALSSAGQFVRRCVESAAAAEGDA